MNTTQDKFFWRIDGLAAGEQITFSDADDILEMLSRMVEDIQDETGRSFTVIKDDATDLIIITRLT